MRLGLVALFFVMVVAGAWLLMLMMASSVTASASGPVAMARARLPRNASGRAPAPARGDEACHVRAHHEYEGSVVIWGATHTTPTAEDCCAACKRQAESAKGGPRCKLWVWCADPTGCGGQPFKSCWGKTMAEGVMAPPVRNRGESCPWTSGGLFSAAEARAIADAEVAAVAAQAARRDRPVNPRVFFDVAIEDKPAGRVEFVLYALESPRAAENFRAMCTGEHGGKKSFSGMAFYRIIDRFIDQAGVHGVNSVWDVPFDDDPEGLKLKHDRPGLLSAANSGPNTNSGHFSIVVAPAPHLDGSYTIFGEVVAGMDTVEAVNKLTVPGKDRPTGKAVVVRAGCLSACGSLGVGPKCSRHEDTLVQVQGKPVKPCLD